jgi:hypothetical protein
MEVSGMNVCACECVWRWNKWEKVSMVSCVPLVLMQGLGTTGPTGQRCQLSPNNYLRTINHRTSDTLDLNKGQGITGYHIDRPDRRFHRLVTALIHNNKWPPYSGSASGLLLIALIDNASSICEMWITWYTNVKVHRIPYLPFLICSVATHIHTHTHSHHSLSLHNLTLSIPPDQRYIGPDFKMLNCGPILPYQWYFLYELKWTKYINLNVSLHEDEMNHSIWNVYECSN